MKILLADDDMDLVDWLGYALQKNGYTVLKAYHGDAALRMFEQELPDVVVLDLIMPRRGGIEVLAEIRKRSQAPIIMLTNVSDEDKVVEALQSGADDYMVKPFRPRELMARIETITRRSKSARAEVQFHGPLSCGELTLDPRSRQVTAGGAPVHLTPLEFSLLELLLLNQGAVMPAAEIMNRVWGYSADEGEHTLRMTVSRLRAKVEPDPSHPRYIHNVAGAGYKVQDMK